MTRGMFVTILGRIEGIQPTAYSGCQFFDVEADQWYSPYIAWATQAEVVDGYNSRFFGPNDLVTREQMATIIKRYLDYRKMELPISEQATQIFRDMEQVSPWAKDGVERARQLGLLQGDNQGCVNPKNPATRAQVAVLCTRLDQSLSQKYFLYGDGKQTDSANFELTELKTWQSGSVWLSKQIETTKGFAVSFSYWAGGGRDDAYGGADGIILALSEKMGLGSDGEYLGFVGDGAYGIELDSYPRNPNDPDGKHIAVVQDKVANHLASVLDNRVDDSAWHNVQVKYLDGTLIVYLDDEEVLSVEGITLEEKIYLGLSAATGSGKNQHLVSDFWAGELDMPQKQVELYGGPGTQYQFLGKIDEEKIDGYIREEKNWVEVEYGSSRAYVRKSDLSDLNTTSLPLVVYSVIYGPTLRPYQIFFDGLDYTLTCDVPVYSGPDEDSTQTNMLSKDDIVSVLYEMEGETIVENLNPFILIEYEVADEKTRGYVYKNTLLDINNPLRNFNEVKKSNAAFTYGGETYYSTAGTPREGDGWTTVFSDSLTQVRFNLLNALTGVIASNGDDVSLKNETWLYDAKLGGNVSVDVSTSAAERMNAFSDLLGMANAALASGNDSIAIQVDLETYDGEGRMLVRGGAPFESPLAGKTVSLASLIAKGGALDMVTSSAQEDTLIRQLYPGISGSEKCSMTMTFSNDYADNPYGYSYIIDRNGLVYAQLIFHNGTHFYVYQGGEYVGDLAPYLSGMMVELNDKSASRILEVLSEYGFYKQ